MTDLCDSEDGTKQVLECGAGSESPPSVGSVASYAGGGDIDESLFEGSSSEDEEDARKLESINERRDSPVEETSNDDGCKRRSMTSRVVEIDHDMFGSDSDGDQVQSRVSPSPDSNGTVQVKAGTTHAARTHIPMNTSATKGSVENARPEEVARKGSHKRTLATFQEPHDINGQSKESAIIASKVLRAREREKNPTMTMGRAECILPAAGPKSTVHGRVPRKKLGQSSTSSASSVWARMRQQSTTIQGKKKHAKSSVPFKDGIRKSSSPAPTAAASRRSSQTYPNVELGQYWRSIRNWDFVPALNSYVGQSQNSAEENLPGGRPALPLPDQFESIEQYKALWAPLALREAKSQTLSEVSASMNEGGGRGLDASFVKAQCVGGDDSDVHSECFTVIVHEISGGAAAPGRGGRSANVIFENEMILLVRDRSTLEIAAKGKFTAESCASSSSMKWGLMGNAAARSKTVNGLTIKVSRRRWKSHGSREMHLYRLGDNVTALREFTALCRADSIPLAGLLLGKQSSQIESTKGAPSELLDPLSERGGANSLPPGFRIFVKANFNPSQLHAISAAAREYGSGGFTLVKGPPGTGKTTTLVALLNSLHLRQYQKYYSEIERITTEGSASGMYEALAAIHAAAKTKPRILVCAPSNAAVDNIIAKVIQVQFVDGVGKKYRPSIVRVGAGQSSSVRKVSLQTKRDAVVAIGNDPNQLEALITDLRRRLKGYQREIQKLQRRVKAIADASPHPLSSSYEIRIDEETFDHSGQVLFVNHETKSATFIVPPPPQPHETAVPAKNMPHYRTCVDNLCRYVEKHNEASCLLEQYIYVQNAHKNLTGRNYNKEMSQLNTLLETNILDSEHIVCTTLGSAGSRTMDAIAKFEVVVIDEAAQSSEPATLVGLQLGSSHALLVGDPQQLPATIFSVSGRITKYDRSLFQRLEEAGNEVHLLDTQYRMNPKISEFPRKIFYDNCLLDGPNVRNPEYGNTLGTAISQRFPFFQHFTIFDLDSTEERGGTSLSNYDEAKLVLHLFQNLDSDTVGIPPDTRVAIITPYSQQVALLRRIFMETFGESYESKVEISTVDAYQGREACIIIFSCVRAAQTGGGIGFLSDVQRMNVALTRAKHFLFVIAHCQTIVVNPYWRDLVCHARKQGAVIPVPRLNRTKNGGHEMFPNLALLRPLSPGGRNDQMHRGVNDGGRFTA